MAACVGRPARESHLWPPLDQKRAEVSPSPRPAVPRGAPTPGAHPRTVGRVSVEMSSTSRVLARIAPPPPLASAAAALRHLRETLEAHGEPAFANLTVDRLGYVVRADPMFHELAWLEARGSRALRESSFAALVPELLTALARRTPASGRTVHDAWLGQHEIRVRYWLMPGASPAHTDLSIYLQFA